MNPSRSQGNRQKGAHSRCAQQLNTKDPAVERYIIDKVLKTRINRRKTSYLHNNSQPKDNEAYEMVDWEVKRKKKSTIPKQKKEAKGELYSHVSANKSKRLSLYQECTGKREFWARKRPDGGKKQLPAARKENCHDRETAGNLSQ